MASRGAGGRVLACGHARDTRPHLGHTPSLPDVFRAASASPTTNTKQRPVANTASHLVANTNINPPPATVSQATRFFAQQLHFFVASIQQAPQPLH